MTKPLRSIGAGVMEINKARIGMMTVQFATTLRKIPPTVTCVTMYMR